jgi:transposase-like protein
MKETKNEMYAKRTQKDYTLSFKLQVVQEVESGELTATSATRKYGIQGDSTVRNWIKKFGNFDREMYVDRFMKKSPQQRIFELEQENLKLKREKAALERQVNLQDQKAIMFDAIVEIAQEDYNINLLKKVFPEQSNDTLKKGDKE